ncbi:MAG: PAS domain S-box protein, partial [Deltaproteobacteria bacterium]|nr:PAS domain S-box protein [Deltaproteobacteria bacterium]
TLLEQLPVGVYRTTKHGRIIQGNPALARMLGYSVEELEALSADDVFADPTRRREQLEEWQERGGVVSDELRFRRGDGTVIWIRDTGQAIAGDDGKVRYFDGVIEDITERKRAEQALQEERERLDTVLRNIADGVIAIDPSFKIEIINPMAAQFLDTLVGPGWNRSPLTTLGGRSIESLLETPPEGDSTHVIAVEEPRKRVFELSAREMRRGTEVRGWVLLVRDVSREREIRRGMETQSRLSAMGQLAAGVAHDFNNALCGILANADMLKRSPELSDGERERLEQISRSCEGAAMLIRQILDFSRHRTASPRPMDLAQAARAVMTLLERSLPGDVRTDLDALPGSYRVLAEISAIQQVLTNLVLNARDALPEGGTISVRVGREHVRSMSVLPFETLDTGSMEPCEWVTLEVSDTGSGIPDDVLPSIFEPFFTTKAPDEGSGLGLAQVYGIVKQYRGHVDVETEVGHGSTFKVYLPALAED